MAHHNIITDMFKRVLFCSQAFEGSTHDFTMFKSIFSGLDFSRLTVWVDLGFLGIDKQVRAGTLFIAFKASKHQPLDEITLKYNSIISSIRVKIEHAIANLKTFSILRNKNRMRNDVKLTKVFDVCVRLANFRLNSLTIN